MRLKPLVALLLCILEFDDVRRTHFIELSCSVQGSLAFLRYCQESDLTDAV